MKKLLFLAIFATAVGFTNGNAASQPGVDCDQVLIDVYYDEIAAGNSGASQTAADAWADCWMANGNSSNEVIVKP